MAWVHGLGGHGEEERRTRLFGRVEALLDEVGIPRSLADAGVGAAEFEAALPELAEAAFMDPSLRTNPRMPLVAGAGRPAARRLGRPLADCGELPPGGRNDTDARLDGR